MPLDEIRKRANEAKPDSLIQVSEADLREIATSNPSHPAAQIFLNAADQRKEENEYALASGSTAKNTDFSIDREDLLAILENKEVVVTRTKEKIRGKEVPVIRKTLGKSLAEGKPDSKPVKDNAHI